MTKVFYNHGHENVMTTFKKCFSRVVLVLLDNDLQYELIF